MDDKIAVIICVTIIVLCAMFQLADPNIIVTNGISGLFGVAVGKALKP